MASKRTAGCPPIRAGQRGSRPKREPKAIPVTAEEHPTFFLAPVCAAVIIHTMQSCVH